MKKKDIISRIAEITGSSKAHASDMYNAFQQAVQESQTDGENVELVGFVNFVVDDVPDAIKRNPKTGESVEVPAHKKVKVKVSNTLKDIVR